MNNLTAKPTKLLLHITAGPNTDAAKVDDLTRQLRQVLLEHDVGSVDQVRATMARPNSPLTMDG